MSLRLVAVTFDVEDSGVAARFWSGLLGREVVIGADDAVLPATEVQVGLRFVSTARETDEHRLHLHVTSSPLQDQQHTVDRAVGLGATHVDVGQRPDESHIVLADPVGNLFCVIEPQNRFLAGCGLLGEVACDGSREVGLFWSEALGWPLVWDQDQETAVQSPAGGTKISWGGPPLSPKIGRNWQRFDLETSDLAAEIERLVECGATLLGDADRVEMTDPDGNEFSIRATVS